MCRVEPSRLVHCENTGLRLGHHDLLRHRQYIAPFDRELEFGIYRSLLGYSRIDLFWTRYLVAATHVAQPQRDALATDCVGSTTIVYGWILIALPPASRTVATSSS